MKEIPLLNYEEKYQDKLLIAGIDEAGRGPLAGPVVCACVIMPYEKDKRILGVNDSKKLTPKKRAMLYQQIVETAISYCIVEISEREIDEINILNATKKGMKKALEGLEINPEIVLIDAVHLDGISILQDSVVHGDAVSYNIACASILAKVYRDKLMEEYAKKYPDYFFEKHKGYGTKVHIDALKKYGACPLHRASFIKNFIN